MRKTSLARFVVEQAIIGGALGAVLAITVLDLHSRRIYTMMTSGDAPILTVAIFVAALSATFAIGSSLTGFLLKVADESP